MTFGDSFYRIKTDAECYNEPPIRQCNCSPNQCETSPTETYGIYTLKVNISVGMPLKKNMIESRWDGNSQVPI